jgi:hypothetical protein
MTDRELLEKAAKAAGMEHMRWSGPMGLSRMLDPDKPDTTGSVGPYWNPLTDDGDALRLVVKLRLELGLGIGNCAYAFRRHDVSGVAEEYIGTDPCAATRRAIVRAAAALAGGKP